MRFPRLKIGQQFDYDGKRYTKTGPLTAAEEGSGESVMIRRAAEVIPVYSVDGDESVKQLKQSFSRQEVMELCQAYRLRLTNALQSKVDKRQNLHIDTVISALSEIDPV
ncbi:MAG: hypothetical protein AB2598_00690 [Candidatus Thiodiazotropha sp.]